jgi:hypothetical protein
MVQPSYGGAMDFIDIPGVTGTQYRFRRWPDFGATPPIAGAYALVDLTTHKLVALGVMDDLSQAQVALTVPPRTALFTRYNVSRTHRETEHADIVGQHPDLAEE